MGVSQANRERILSQSFASLVMFAIRHGVLCVVLLPSYPSFLPHVSPLFLPHWHISGHRDRLMTCSRVNRMSSDQSGQENFLAAPSLVSPQNLSDCRGQRGPSLLPCISSLPCSVLRHVCHSYEVLSLLKSEDASDPILFIVFVALAAP